MPDAKPMPSVTRFGDHVRLELHPQVGASTPFLAA
jgi:hypothetical protein